MSKGNEVLEVGRPTLSGPKITIGADRAIDEPVRFITMHKKLLAHPALKAYEFRVDNMFYTYQFESGADLSEYIAESRQRLTAR